MKVFVVGASGATGKLLVKALLDRNCQVTVVVRPRRELPKNFIANPLLEQVTANFLEMSDSSLEELLVGCDAVACCLGHNLTLKGVYGQPRRLVTQAVQKLCVASKRSKRPSSRKFVLMNTTGNRNRDLVERISFAQKCVIGLIRLMLPPHGDNEAAADFLRTEIGKKSAEVEWAVVRPDGLVDENVVTEYRVHRSPTKSAIFDPGTTSRINVAHFMAELILSDSTWQQWRGQMPVIYNLE